MDTGIDAWWRHPLLSYLLAVSFLLIYACVYPLIRINYNHSMPQGLYWCPFESSTTELPPGTLVIFVPTLAVKELFLMTHGGFKEDMDSPWLKRVIRQDGDNLYVEGTHPRSFDSHRFGPIPRVSVQRLCTSLWTWE